MPRWMIGLHAHGVSVWFEDLWRKIQQIAFDYFGCLVEKFKQLIVWLSRKSNDIQLNFARYKHYTHQQDVL